GSGTTTAAAHKMNRKYIGIEQMSYIEDITVPRMHRVVKGDSSGISSDDVWKGGGAFIDCELLDDRLELLKEVKESNEESIQLMKNKIDDYNRIIPYITKAELEEVDTDLENMDLKDKKKALISLIDKNKLYVNFSDIEDENYNIKDEDKKFNKLFYEREV